MTGGWMLVHWSRKNTARVFIYLLLSVSDELQVTRVPFILGWSTLDHFKSYHSFFNDQNWLKSEKISLANAIPTVVVGTIEQRWLYCQFFRNVLQNITGENPRNRTRVAQKHGAQWTEAKAIPHHRPAAQGAIFRVSRFTKDVPITELEQTQDWPTSDVFKLAFATNKETSK